MELDIYINFMFAHAPTFLNVRNIHADVYVKNASTLTETIMGKGMNVTEITGDAAGLTELYG